LEPKRTVEDHVHSGEGFLHPDGAPAWSIHHGEQTVAEASNDSPEEGVGGDDVVGEPAVDWEAAPPGQKRDGRRPKDSVEGHKEPNAHVLVEGEPFLGRFGSHAGGLFVGLLSEQRMEKLTADSY
jgi:hypothetical protein